VGTQISDPALTGFQRLYQNLPTEMFLCLIPFTCFAGGDVTA